MAACFYRANQENLVGDQAEVYPKSQETLYLGLADDTITFKGAVRQTFETSWADAN
jgi:diaminopimelate epimerase